MAVEVITKEFYKVGGYLFENINRANALDGVIGRNPDARICPTCKGMGQYSTAEAYSVPDENGYPSSFSARITSKRCGCHDGIQFRKVTEEWK